jgi:KDO2-lipid IV(A) lauroyltransferase
MTHLAYLFMRRRKKIALANLGLAFGNDKNENEKKAICKGAMINFASAFAEVLYFVNYPKRLDPSIIQVEGREYLEAAISQGRGVVIFSAHLGNFGLGMMRLVRLGYPVNVVVRNPRLEPLARFLGQISQGFGLTFIPDRPPLACAHRCLEALRRKELLFLLIDLNVGKGGIYVDFFGKLVPTFKGPAVLALRTGAPILPMFVVKDDAGRHKLIIEPELEYQTSGDRRQDVYDLTVRFSKVAESYVRAHPEQWFWLHRRFRKAKPAAR